MTSGLYSKTSTLHSPIWVGPDVGEAVGSGVVVAGLGAGLVELPLVAVGAGVVWLRPAIMIPAMMTAMTIRAPTSAQVQPGRPRRQRVK